MYNNNCTRKLDNRGRLVIPKHIREVYDLENCRVEIFSENDLICIRKVDPERVLNHHARGTSSCNFCLCSSCTGFGCPWIVKIYRYQTDGLLPWRCHRCGQDVERFGPIHDCDFYTSRKRKRFYVRRKLNQPSKLDLLIEDVKELKSILTGK